jgi:glyoxylase-like metal-dependent hydrolase (beta-lactamase superfamily II)
MTKASATHKIGDVAITRIPEISLTIAAPVLLPDWDPAVASADHIWLVPDHMSAFREHLTISVHAWLVRTSKHTILVDTGIGNGKIRISAAFNRLETPFLAKLADVGVKPKDVTHVLHTHVHTDHVGWNTRLENGRWIPTFKNARHFIPRLGYNYFNSKEGQEKPNYDMYADSVIPVLEAGQVELIDPAGGEVLDGFTYHPTPGHSVDHMSIILNSRDEQGIFAGDVLHHPTQLRRPEWSSIFCVSPELAEISRRKVLDLVSNQSMLYFSSHFAGPSVGTVSQDGDAYRWRFV